MGRAEQGQENPRLIVRLFREMDPRGQGERTEANRGYATNRLRETSGATSREYVSGEAEDWPEFRRYFLELTEKEGLPPAILMAQLREQLDTQEARAMIAGKTDPTEAWAALNSRYGDKELALVNVMQKLA